MGPRARLAGAAVVLGGVVAFLAHVGRGALPSPPLTHPSTIGSWASNHDPVLAAFAIVRLVALVLACYLFGVTVLQLVAAAVRSRPLDALSTALTLPVVRRALASVAGAGVTAAATVTFAATSPLASASPPNGSSISHHAAITRVDARQVDPPPIGDATPPNQPGLARLRPVLPDGPGVATLREAPTTSGPADPPPPSTATLRAVPRSPSSPAPPAPPAPPAQRGEGPSGVAPPASTATMHALPSTPATEPPAAQPAPHAAPAQPPASSPGTPGLHVVQPGESFWSIADDVLRATLQRAPTESEIDAYWRVLLAANADRLVHAGQPDLIFVGQTFVVPTAPAGPGAPAGPAAP